MRVISGLVGLLLLNLLTLVLPALVVAWLFTLVLPVPFDQMVWLIMGTLLVIRYVLLSLTDVPGETDMDIVGAITTPIFALILLAVSGLCGWLLLRIFSLDLTVFQSISLFAVSLTAGFYFTARSGTGGLPMWLRVLPNIDEPVEEDDFIIPVRKPRKRKGQTMH